METKLTLVNHLLKTVGEAIVVTLETGHPSVTQAISALDGYNRDFQTKGWWFNRNRAVKLVPNNRGEITLPAECLEFNITSDTLQYRTTAEKSRYTQRGKYVYDTYLNTIEIGKGLTADMVILLDYEDLPQIAATYLKHLAAKEYYVDDDGDNQKAALLQNRVDNAWAQLQAAALKSEAINALDSPSAEGLIYRSMSGTYRGNPIYPGGRY